MNGYFFTTCQAPLQKIKGIFYWAFQSVEKFFAYGQECLQRISRPGIAGTGDRAGAAIGTGQSPGINDCGSGGTDGLAMRFPAGAQQFFRVALQ